MVVTVKQAKVEAIERLPKFYTQWLQSIREAVERKLKIIDLFEYETPTEEDLIHEFVMVLGNHDLKMDGWHSTILCAGSRWILRVNLKVPKKPIEPKEPVRTYTTAKPLETSL